MRVYEIAKQMGLSSKEVISLLDAAGFEVTSHMAVVSQEAQAALEKKLRAQAAPKESPQKKEKESTSAKMPDTASTKKQPQILEKEKQQKPSMPEKLEVKTAEVKADVSIETEVATPKNTIAKIGFQSPEEIVALEKNHKKLTGRGESSELACPVEKKIEKPALAPRAVTEVSIQKEMPVIQAAELLGRPVGDVILALLKRGMVCNRNHILSVETITSLAHNFGFTVVASPNVAPDIEKRASDIAPASKTMVPRWPIVVVMGHVDHGKTTLLDYIRKMNTAAKEKGGITQHLSAYEVDSTHGKIVFLDTPGHEAFTYMRKRGTSVTDFVVLVIAVDDGVMPQTIEIIKQVKAAELPIIVAVNKMDKVENPSYMEKIKRQLAQYDLTSEDWGGTTICVPISAKTGMGVNELLEMIVLQSQMMELKADPTVEAKGFVLESKQEKGFGPVATVICLNGSIHVGDYFVCGSSTGRVRLLINSKGERVSSAGPAVPVQVVGFDNFVALGDWLKVVPVDVYMEQKSQYKNETELPMQSMNHGTSVGEKAENLVPLIIKTDTQGTREAVLGVIKKIAKTQRDGQGTYQVIYSGIGDVSEKDVDFASHAGALLVGLHVKVEKNAQILAKEQSVDIRSFDIIYKMMDDLVEHLKQFEEEVVVLKKVGEASVRKIFDLKAKGVIAGCYVNEGVLSRNNLVTCFRGKQKIGSGKIVSLQRDRKVVKEVHAGYECGFLTDSFHDWQEGDLVHCFVEEKKKRSEL